MAKIEACLNSRPMVALTDDPNDKLALTPGDFLIGQPILAIPHPDITGEKINYVKKWHYMRRLQQEFWQRWSEEYLHTLQVRSKWQNKQNNIIVGDIALVQEQNYPPTHWPLARVIATHPGSDGLVRSVTLRLANSTLRRPIHKLAILPIGTEI